MRNADPGRLHNLDKTSSLTCVNECSGTDERYQLDAQIYLLLLITLHVSGIYMPIFRIIRLYTFHTTAYCVQHCKRELCVSGWFHFMLFALLCNCWLRLCSMLYWVPVLHNTCYAHWSGWKCSGGAGT